MDEASCADGFSFVVMGDNHVNRTVFEVLRDIAVEMKPDFAFSVGDMTKDGREEEYEIFLNQIAKAKMPWFAVPGNHEYRDPEGHTTIDGQSRYRRIFGKSDFAFTHCGWKFIGIDIVAFDALLPGQLHWLENQLKGYDGRAVVFMHYPPALIPNWEEGFWTVNGKEFMKMLEDYRVPYFFSGHIHVYDRIKIGPTNYIVTGGAGGGVDTEKPRGEYNSPDGGGFYHFIFVAVEGDKAVDSVVMPNLR